MNCSQSSEIPTSKRVLDWIVEGLLIFLFFITPLIREGIRIITLLLTIFWLIKKIKYREIPEEKIIYVELYKWVGILGLGFILSFINVINISSAFKKFADEYVLLALIFLISLDVIRNKKQLKRLFYTAIISATIAGLSGLHQHLFEGYTRIKSTLRGANDAGTYFTSIALLGFAYLLFKNKLKHLEFVAASLFTLLSLACVFYAGSRGAWLSLFGGFISLLFFAVKNKRFIDYKKVIVVFVILVLAATFIDLGWVFERLNSITDLSNNSNLERIWMIQGGLEMLKDHPLVGVGIGQFEEVYLDYKREAAGSFTHLHCLFLHLAVEIGIIGFLIFSILAYKVIKTGLKGSLATGKEHWYHYGVIGVLIGTAVHNLFEWSFLYVQVGSFTMILLATWLNKTNAVDE